MKLDTVNDYITAGLTHSIHTSERKSFRGCRRRWDWISRQFYYPRVTARPLEFGVAYHAAMEAYYQSYLGLFVNPDPAASLAVALATFKRVVKQQREKYIHLNGGIDEVMDLDYRDRVEQGTGMLKHYFRNVAQVADKGFKPIKVEIKFEVPIDHPETGEILWCKCDWCWRRFRASEQGAKLHDDWQVEFSTKLIASGVDQTTAIKMCAEPGRYKDHWKGLPVTYGGRIDILFEDELGRLWIGDWKTAMRLSGLETNDEYLEMDDQITAYIWALRKIGLDVVGFIYAEIKKAVPEEPEPLKVTRLGRRFSVSKNINTTYDLYKKTVEENDPGAYASGLYDDFLEYLRDNAPVFHLRHIVNRNDEQCRNASLNIWKEAKEMTNPDLLIYPNPGRFHCKGQSTFSGCAFFEPCLGKERGEDVLYSLETMFDKLDRHYWEDAEPTTDKRMEPV
jgi:hypothetical protein